MADTSNTPNTEPTLAAPGDAEAQNEVQSQDGVLQGSVSVAEVMGQAGAGAERPLTDETQLIDDVAPGDNFVLPADVTLANLQADGALVQQGGSLVITLPSGSVITLQDYFLFIDDLPPALTLADGNVIDPQEVIAILGDEFNPDAIAAAAGGQGGGGAGNASFSAYASGDIGPGGDEIGLLGDLPGFPFQLPENDEEGIPLAGSIQITPVTETDVPAPEGSEDVPNAQVVVGTFEGAFEDSMPNKHIGASDVHPTQITFEFIADNEMIEQVTLLGFPQGTHVFVNGVETVIEGPTQEIVVSNANLDSVFIIPPFQDDHDLGLGFQALITDPDSTTGAPIIVNGNFEVVVDAVADIPTVALELPDEPPVAEIGEPVNIHGFIDVVATDDDGSEQQFARINVKDANGDDITGEITLNQGTLITLANPTFTVGDVEIDFTPAEGVEFVPFWAVLDGDLSNLEITFPEGTPEGNATVFVFGLSVEQELDLGIDELTLANNLASMKKPDSFDIFVHVNFPPDAVDDAYNTPEDTTLVITVPGILVNDTDPDNDPLTVVSNTLPSHGTLTVNEDGSFTYTPDPGFEGDDTFFYTIEDPDGEQDTAMVTITVPKDSVPVLKSVDSVELDEDGFVGANADAGRTGETDSTESTTAVGTIVVDFANDVPADLPGSIQLSAAGLSGQLETLDGHLVDFTANADGSMLTGTVEDSGGRERVVMEIKITGATEADGTVTYSYESTLFEPLAHPSATAEDSVVLQNIGFQVTDSDGDMLAGSFDATVVDDIPVAADGENAFVGATVEEDDLNNAQSVGDNEDGSVGANTAGGVAGSLLALFSAGADAPLVLSLSDDTSGLPHLLSKGDAVSYAVVGDTLTASADGSVSGDGPRDVFTLTVNGDGSWSFELIDQLDHVAGGGENFALRLVEGGSVGTIDFSSLLHAEDQDGDEVDGALPGHFAIQVMDDVPVAIEPESEQTSGPGGFFSVSVDEDELSTSDGDLSDGITDNDSETDEASFTNADLVSALVVSGADEPVTFALNDAVDNTNVGSVTSLGEQVVFHVVDANQIDGVAGGDRVVFSLTSDGNGNFTFDLKDQLDHLGFGDEESLSIDLTGAFKAADFDDDPVALNPFSIQVFVENDVPALVASPATIEGEVKEDGLSTVSGDPGDLSEGNKESGETNADDEDSGSGLASLQSLFVVGADAPLSFGLSQDQAALDGLPHLLSNGDLVTYAVTVDDMGNSDPTDDVWTLTATADQGGGNERTVFTLTVNGNGTWAFDLDDQLDHVDDGNNDENTQLQVDGEGSPSVPYIDFSGLVVATDSDGDEAPGLPDGTFRMVVEDDIPTVMIDADGTPDPVAVVAGGSIGGDWAWSVGADEPATILVSVDGPSGPESQQLTGNSVSFNLGVYGTLTVNADGSWSFDAGDDFSTEGGDPKFTFTIAVTDADGDEVSDDHMVTITSLPTGGDTLSLSVDEAALDLVADDRTAPDPDDILAGAVNGSDPASDDETDAGGLTFTAGTQAINSIVFDDDFISNPITVLNSDASDISGDLTWTLSPDGKTLTGELSGVGDAIVLQLSGPSGIAALDTADVTVTATLLDAWPHASSGTDQISISGIVVTVSDGTNEASGTVAVAVIDDVPSVDGEGATDDSLQVDESDFATDATVSFAALFTATYGADLPGTLGSYALGISANGADTGLDDSLTGSNVVLSMDGDDVVGAVQGSGEEVFRLSVDASGNVTLDQSRSVLHTPDSGPDQETSLLSAGLVTLSATATDADGDQATAAIDLGHAISFRDDAPAAGDPQALFLANALGNSGTADLDFSLSTDESQTYALTMAMGAAGTQVALADGAGVYGLFDGVVQQMTSDGTNLVWNDNSDGTWSAVTSGDETTVFTVSVNTDGTYTVELDGDVPLDGAFEEFELTFTGGVTGGNNAQLIFFDSTAGDTNPVDGIPDGSTIMALATGVDSDGTVGTVNSSTNGMGVSQGNTIDVTNGISEKLFLDFGDPVNPALINGRGDPQFVAQSVNLATITFNILDSDEFAVVGVHLDSGGDPVWFKVAGFGNGASANADVFLTIEQGTAGAGSTGGSGTLADPFVVDMGGDRFGTATVDDLFATLEFRADVASDSDYRLLSAQGVNIESGDDIHTVFTATATDADLDVASTTFDVTFDSGLNIVGTSGDDVLVGSDIAQHLEGQGGNDIMTGNAGDDTFVFGADALVGENHITDFALDMGGEADSIDLDGLFDALGAGSGAAREALLQNDANGADGQTIITINDGGASQFSIVLDGFDTDIATLLTNNQINVGDDS